MATLADIEQAARRTIGDDDIHLTRESVAADVPGWDSLTHLLITLELSRNLGVELSARELARFANMGELVDYLNDATARKDG